MTEDDSSSTHPPLPPTTEDDRFNRLRLLRSRRVGPVTYRKLLRDHGTAAAALEVLPDLARSVGVPDYQICPEAVVHHELKSARATGARLVFEGEADFPPALSQISDAPAILWQLGQADVLARPMIALVGARNASSLGTRMARKLAQDLGAAGFTIVSGLARGIDAAAHGAALNTGTIAVLAGGVDVLYPAENADLAQKIGSFGLRLSDQPMGQQPSARHFVARNRLISGLSMATIVVEAAAKSGSLITARTALDQGRDVLAVPGHPFEVRASGCNMLIRDGATLVRGAQDVLDHLGTPSATAAKKPVPAPAPRPATPSQTLAQLQGDILSRLGSNPIGEDQLIRIMGAAATLIAPILMDLELDGKIIREPGGLLSRVV